MRTAHMTSSPDAPIYVVGEVHGMLDTLGILIDGIENHAKGLGAKPRFLFLGDLNDYGPSSYWAIDRVVSLLHEYPGSQVIRGIHGELFLDFIKDDLDPASTRHWLTRLGGINTLRSYSQGPLALRRRFGIKDFPRYINSAYPDHVALLEQAADLIFVDDMCAVHEGINPDVPMAAQSLDDLRPWGPEFLAHKEPFERMVIHGHSINWSYYVEEFSNRISLNSGAVYGGRLSAAVLRGPSEISYIDAQVNDDTYVVRHIPRHVVMDEKAHCPPEGSPLSKSSEVEVFRGNIPAYAEWSRQHCLTTDAEYLASLVPWFNY
jgi:serine/threonine protein phosphatase 1